MICKHRGICASLLAVSISLTGCSNMSDQDRTKAQGGVLGAVGGAIVGTGLGLLAGAAAARQTGDSSYLLIGGIAGGVAGATAGGVLGYQYGMKVAEKKAQYANSEDFYLAEIGEIQKNTTAIRSANARLSKSVASLQSRKSSLDAALAAGTIDKKNYKLQFGELRKEIRVAQTQAKPVEELVGYQRAVLQDVQSTGATKSTASRLAAAAKAQEQAFAPYEAMMSKLTRLEKPAK
jgi:hypothetical protein